MNLLQSLDNVKADLSQSLPALAPEIALVVTIILLLIVPLFLRSLQLNLSWLALVGTLCALALSVTQLPGSFPQMPDSVRPLLVQATEPHDIFASGTQADGSSASSGLLRFDAFAVFFRIFLFFFTLLVIWLTQITGIPDKEDSPDFYTLLLGATLGMSLMVAANHLLMVFIAVEMASLPSYAMAGFLKGRRESSEAALKYVVFGAGAAGIMLYGISLLIGKYGTAHIPTLVKAIADSGTADGALGALSMGLLLLLVGIAFKISAVPFHFWCPDVFEGASAEVAGFLSVASKAAALALLARLSMAFQSIVDPPIHFYSGTIIGVLAAVTATYGNLAAFVQTNLKRLLGFSTIAHAGYMMMAVAAAVALGPESATGLHRTSALGSLLFYLIVYLFMNLGAFTIVALIRNKIRSEDLADYTGLIYQSPFLTIAMAIFLLSLTGIPPLAGFAAKFQIFAALYDAKLNWLLIVGLLNTVFSLFYYVKVLRVMILDPTATPTPDTPHWTIPASVMAFCGFLLVVNLGLMVASSIWNAMNGLSELAANQLSGTF